MEKMMQVAEIFGIHVYLESMSWCDGEIYINKRGVPFITIDPEAEDGLEWVMAHELGHYFLHMPFGYDMDVATKKEKERVEAEAQHFADGMLRILGRAS